MQDVAAAGHLSSAEPFEARALHLTAREAETTIGAIGRVKGSLDVKLYAADAGTLGACHVPT
jgi:hypothetical protein